MPALTNPEMSYSDLTFRSRAVPAGQERRLEIDGEEWRVYERPAAHFDRRQAPSLVFESRGAIRRVREYPADWFRLDDRALAALSWRR